MSDVVEEEFLTTKEVSKRYRNVVNVRTLANWRSLGDGPPFVKVGGRVLYPLKSLIAWESKRTLNK